jgi:hypothetical protein
MAQSNNEGHNCTCSLYGTVAAAVQYLALRVSGNVDATAKARALSSSVRECFGGLGGHGEEDADADADAAPALRRV